MFTKMRWPGRRHTLPSSRSLSPITDGFLVSGNTNVNGASGEANLSIPVSGPKGKGTIYAAATKSLGRWNYSGLVLEIEKTHQPSRRAGACELALITPVKAAINNLSVSAILFGILGGVIGIAAGLFLGFALGSALAAAFHVSTFEGEAGYFAVAIALLVTFIVTPLSILLVLYWRGVRNVWLFIGLVIVCVSIAAIGASGFGIWYAEQPHVLNINGPTPLLEFEVKPPAGQSLESLTEVQPELDTDRNAMPGYWHTDAPANSGVRAGYVELYFRTSKRLFVLKFPGGTDRIFQLHLPANPMRAKYRAWSEWQNPHFIAKAGEQPTRPSGGIDYQIRYKLDYQDR